MIKPNKLFNLKKYNFYNLLVIKFSISCLFKEKLSFNLLEQIKNTWSMYKKSAHEKVEESVMLCKRRGERWESMNGGVMEKAMIRKKKKRKKRRKGKKRRRKRKKRRRWRRR